MLYLPFTLILFQETVGMITRSRGNIEKNRKPSKEDSISSTPQLLNNLEHLNANFEKVLHIIKEEGEKTRRHLTDLVNDLKEQIIVNTENLTLTNSDATNENTISQNTNSKENTTKYCNHIEEFEHNLQKIVNTEHLTLTKTDDINNKFEKNNELNRSNSSVHINLQHKDNVKQQIKEKSQQLDEIQKNLRDEWIKAILKRRSAYWTYYKTKKIHDFYKEEILKENPKMPRKLQPKCIKNEPIEETEIRKKHAKVMLEFDIKLSKARYERKQKEIDNKIENIIKEQSRDTILQNELLKQWKFDKEEEEKTSEKIFFRKEDWFRDNWTDEFKSNKKSKVNINDNSKNDHNQNDNAINEQNRNDNTKNKENGKVQKKKRWKHSDKKRRSHIVKNE